MYLALFFCHWRRLPSVAQREAEHKSLRCVCHGLSSKTPSSNSINQITWRPNIIQSSTWTTNRHFPFILVTAVFTTLHRTPVCPKKITKINVLPFLGVLWGCWRMVAVMMGEAEGMLSRAPPDHRQLFQYSWHYIIAGRACCGLRAERAPRSRPLSLEGDRRRTALLL